MLPNFLIIGAQKAATTWLAQCLGEHPNVLMSDEKELHFFNNRFERGLAWYEAHFSEWSGEAATGEATPGYIHHSDVVPGRVQATLGNEVKLIASLRHPVDRAYSAFGQYMRQGRIPPNTDFQTALQQGAFNMRRRGHYFADLKRYLTYFPRENLFVLIYEEIKKDEHKAISDCFVFLEVDSQFIPQSLKTKVNKGTNQRMFHHQAIALRRYIAAKTNLLPRSLRGLVLEVGRRAYKNLILERLPEQNRYEPLDPELRQELLQGFMPDIRQLEDLLGRDLSIWYVPPCA